MTNRDDPSALLAPDAASHHERRQLRRVILVSLAVAAYLFLWTLGTAPVLGDEARHYRRATNYYEAPLPHLRVTHDPAYPAVGPNAVQYWGTCLWHLALAILWKAVGHRSLLAAQLYHSAFFLALALFTYLAGRELFGHRAAIWAWALVITVPMNLLFAMVFYLEIPMLAFAAIALFFLVRSRPVPLGLAMGGMFLVKSPSAAVLIPPMLLAAALTIGPTWRRRALRTAIAAAVLLVVLLPDMAWHMEHFGRPIMFRSKASASVLFPVNIQTDFLRLPSPTRSAVPFSLFSPRAVLEMLGLTGLVALALALAVTLRDLGHTLWETLRAARSNGWPRALATFPDHCPTPSLILGLPILFYIPVYAVMLRRSHDVRYLEPLTLFAGLLAAPLADHAFQALRDRPRRRLAAACGALLAAAALAQLLVVPAYVHRQRRLDPRIRDAFRWIQQNTPPDARFLYIEENLTTFTGRPIVWAILTPRYFFHRDTPHSRQVELLTLTDVRYIAVHPTRRCPSASLLQEVLRYPEDWIASLPGRPYLELVYPPDYEGNPADKFLIYRLDYDKIPAEWRPAPLSPLPPAAP